MEFHTACFTMGAIRPSGFGRGAVRRATRADLQARCEHDLFSRHGLVKIDYLSVDTEGVEPMALRTIDYDKVEIDIIGIEENNQRNELRQILEPKGYSLCHTLGPDVFFCRNGFHRKSVSEAT